MGIPLFGVDIAGIVKNAMASTLPIVQLVKKTNGTRVATALTAGTNPKSSTSTARGFTSYFKDSQVNGTTIQKGDRKVLIIGDTLPAGVVPEPADSIIVEGVTMVIVEDGVQRDPAAATYECHVRIR